MRYVVFVFFFFQAEDGIRDLTVTGVQTCALPISTVRRVSLPIDQPTEEVDLLLEDTSAVVTAGQLDSLRVEDIGGHRLPRHPPPPLGRGAPPAGALSARRVARGAPGALGVPGLGARASGRGGRWPGSET